MNLAEEMDILRREVLKRRIDEAGGSVTEAARVAGVGRKWFYKLMKQAAIAPPNPKKRRVRGTAEWRAMQ